MRVLSDSVNLQIRVADHIRPLFWFAKGCNVLIDQRAMSFVYGRTMTTTRGIHNSRDGTTAAAAALVVLRV